MTFSKTWASQHWKQLALCAVVGGVAAVSLGKPIALAQADLLQSNSFILQFGNLNTGSGFQSSSSYNLTNTTGQTGAGAFSGLDKFLGSGFQYIYTIDSFRFAISKLNIDFGQLAIGTHTTDSLTLTLDTKGAGGYVVYAYEINPLKHISGSATIPNTTCDAGDCTTSLARPWTNQSVPGFGFNASGNSVSTDFINSTYFRPFANQATAQPMQPIMQATEIASSEQATITYKVGVDASQQAGEYQTGVVFVAVPGF